MFVKKRGQITVFIILGLIILIVFLFINKAANEVQRLKLDKQAEDIKSTIEQSQVVQHYIKLCLKDSAEETLTLLGEQGGRIWDYQNGSSNRTSNPHYSVTINNKTSDVAVGLKGPELTPPLPQGAPNVPYYPNLDGTFEDINKADTYYLGDVGFPKLCDLNGSNMYLDLNGDLVNSCAPIEAFHGTLEPAEYTNSNRIKKPDNIQIQLGNYTSFKVINCINKDFLKQSIGYNVVLGIPNTTVTFGEKNVIFNLQFPIDIQIQNNESLFKRKTTITKSTSFSSTIPVRLKKVYDLSYSVVYEDMVNLTFFLLDDYKTKKSYDSLVSDVFNPEITVGVVKLDNHQDIDLIRITDKSSTIKGLPYTYQFLRENRPPALDLKLSNAGTEFDVFVFEGDELIFRPKGFDPDEDYYNINNPFCLDGNDNCMEKNYSYSGWKETEDYYFNNTCCIQNDFVDCITNCVTYPSGQPHNWTNSNFYTTNAREASYLTSRKDVGDHFVNISVCDEHGVCDWQNLKIRVQDKGQPKAIYSNMFNDINRTYASTEDPYTLSAITSFIIPTTSPSLIIYKWCDDKDFPGCISTDKTLILPNDYYNIKNITLPTELFNSSGTHNLNLSLKSNPLVSDNFIVNVKQCLPHRNNSKSYPYNNFSADPYPDINDSFQADHTCCIGSGREPSTSSSDWGTIVTSASVTSCYNLVEYGTYRSFTYQHLNQLYQLNLTPYTLNSNIQFILFTPSTNPLSTGLSVSDNNKNDIFKRTINRNCDGSRGNVCNGTLTDTITNISCDDTHTGEVRRCSGPSKTRFSTVTNIVYNSVETCTSYIGQTYESIFEGDSSNICNTNTKCSSNDGISSNTGYGSGGHYICNATCGGSNGCSKPTQCFDCYENNECSGGTSSIFTKGVLTGKEFDVCDTTSSQCKTTPFGSSELKKVEDVCISGTTKLKKYSCLNIADQKESLSPYSYVEVDCAGGITGPTCWETSTATGASSHRVSGSCSNGACTYGITSSCNLIRCNSAKTDCLSNCNYDDNNCISGSYCDSSNQCSVKKLSGICSSPSECIGACKVGPDGNSYCTDHNKCAISSGGVDTGVDYVVSSSHKVCIEDSGVYKWVDGDITKCKSTGGKYYSYNTGSHNWDHSDSDSVCGSKDKD